MEADHMQNSKEKTLSQKVADRIIKYILDENLQPGDKLPNETIMCQRLNVGRSSLQSFGKEFFLWNFACDLPPVAQCLDV